MDDLVFCAMIKIYFPIYIYKEILQMVKIQTNINYYEIMCVNVLFEIC